MDDLLQQSPHVMDNDDSRTSSGVKTAFKAIRGQQDLQVLHNDTPYNSNSFCCGSETRTALAYTVLAKAEKELIVAVQSAQCYKVNDHSRSIAHLDPAMCVDHQRRSCLAFAQVLCRLIEVPVMQRLHSCDVLSRITVW